MADAPAKAPASPADRDDNVVERRTLRDYYIILRERLWIALPLALLVAVLFGYKKMQVTPLYFARATMQFEKQDLIVTSTSVANPGVTSDVELNTALGVLQSQKLRQRVIESLTPEEQKILQRAALKRAPPGTAPSSVGLPLGNVVPFSSRSSLLVEIRVTHEDPEAAAIVANKYVDAYMNHILNTYGDKNEGAYKFLAEQAERLRIESEEKDQALQSYMKQHQLISLDSSQNLVAESLRKVGASRDDARLRLFGIEDKVRQVEAYQAEGKSLLEIADIANHGSVPILRSQLTALQASLNLLSERYLERHPSMIEKSNQIAVMEEDLAKAINQAVAELKSRQSEARQTLKTLEDDFARHEQESMRLGELGVEYGSLKRQSDIARGAYTELLKRMNETNTLKNIEKIPLHPLDRAIANFTPVAPNQADIMRTSIGLGILVFLGVAIGLSFIDDRVKSAWDVESFIGVNLLGIIPDLASMKDEEKYSMLLDNKQVPGVEAFLSVYSSIKIHSKLDFPKSILITSTIPGEGKTLISCNIAGSFARHGKKTLLVDCDLRRPMLHRHFKQQNNAGLLTWFENGAQLEGDLATNPLLGIIKVGENLSLLCSGGRSKTPTELLENPLFSQLLERLKREYDLVIVDSPPLGAVTDSLLIAERIDEVVYVCRFNRAYRKHIRLYMRALRSGKNEVLGVVLNGLSPRRIEYYSNYRYYRSYKKYYGAQA